MRRTIVLVVLVVVSLCASGPVRGEEDPLPETPITQWLVMGPVSHPLPALAEEEPEESLKQVLDARAAAERYRLPESGQPFNWFGTSLSWRPAEVGADGVVALGLPEGHSEEAALVAWLATSLATDRFIEVQLEIGTEHLAKVLLDGAEVENEKLSELALEPGNHLLEIKTVFDPDAAEPWSVGPSLVGESASAIDISVEPDRRLGILDVLDATTVTDFKVSPSGDRVILSFSRVRPGTDDRDGWVELRRTGDGALLRTWRGAPSMQQIQWIPSGRGISYVTVDPDSEASTLWMADLESGTTTPLLEKEPEFGGYQWSPTGATIVHWTTEEAEENEDGIKRLRGLLDRMAGHRDLSSLFVVSVPGGAVRRLTAGKTSASAGAFSPDGARLLVTREIEDLSHRPYTRTEVWEIDLEGGGETKVRDGRWISQLEYSPDGSKILVLGGASEFGDAGVADGVDPPLNDFDGQLFIWDPNTGAVDAVTRDFHPAVASARWSRHDGAIYLLAADGEERAIYRYHPADRVFRRLPTGIESVNSFELAEVGSALVASGTSVWQPQQVVVFDDPDAEPRLLAEPAKERFETVLRGEVKAWNHVASDGRTIYGRFYLPVGFEPGETYPAIVNYYGGTSPMDRSFGGRYPAEWWASNGYVVYVLTPTGAYGWGLKDSTVHVNDWGAVTSRQIIEATEAFLEAHPFVDPKRVGCIGASYGGFMTMALVTKTDLFAAAVAHAGISALSSYWGEGYWGYSYGAVANADSFPWNRHDIFVERSPLFNADKVSTPVLLTHGDEDPNVPPGESDQFYAALKLRGVPAEYLRVAGVGHLVMEHDKRALWSRSIVAWFDRWLKGQPEWWEALYPMW